MIVSKDFNLLVLPGIYIAVISFVSLSGLYLIEHLQKKNEIPEIGNKMRIEESTVEGDGALTHDVHHILETVQRG